MKKWELGKKLVAVVILFVLVIRIGYIFVGDKLDRQIILQGETNIEDVTQIPCIDVSQTFQSEYNRLSSLNLIFDGIAENEQGAIVLQISRDDKLLYQTNISLGNVKNNVWHEIFVNIPIENGVEYRLNMYASKECSQIPSILVSNTKIDEKNQAYTQNKRLNGKIVLGYTYLQDSSMQMKIISSLWCCLWGVMAFLGLYFYHIIKGYLLKGYHKTIDIIGKKAFHVALEVLALVVIVNGSGIVFQGFTKLILLVISVISAYGFIERKTKIEKLITKQWQKNILYLLVGYAAFALVGQRMLIYPFGLKITLLNVIVCIFAFIWFMPVVVSMIHILQLLSNRLFFGTRISTFWFVTVTLAFLFIPTLLNLYANNPGISSYDTVATMAENAHNLYGMYDWHPVFYCIILRLIINVWDSTYAVILFQYLFWGLVMLEIFFYLRKKKMSDYFILAIALFTGINAANMLQLNTIWKDIPYAISLVWILIILTKLTLDYEIYSKKWYIYFELVLALLGATLYRKNGIVIFAVIGLALIIAFYKQKRIWYTLAVVVGLIAIIKYPVYSYLEVEEPGRTGMYIGLSQDILGVYYAGGEVSDSTMQMINVMTYYNNAEYKYISTRAYQSYELDVEPIEFILNYLDTFFKNPITMLRAIIDREDIVWDIFTGEASTINGIDYHNAMDTEPKWNEYYPARKYVWMYPLMSAITKFTSETQWISVIVWRCGLFTMLGIISMVTVILKKGFKKYALIVSPMLAQFLSLLLSTGWVDFRYFWPLNLMNMFWVIFSIIILQEGE